MKKLIVSFLFLGLLSLVDAQTITIAYNLGILTGADGATAVPDGSFLQLVAAPAATASTAFQTAPTPTSFTNGSEIVLWSGAFDSSTSFPPAAGSTSIALNSVPGAYAGYSLMVQWYPTLLTTNGNPTSPGYSTPYGQYSTLNDASWVAPSAGGSVVLTLNTISAGGTLLNSMGAATLKTMAATPVPEPATYAAIFGAMALGFVAYRRRLQVA